MKTKFQIIFSIISAIVVSLLLFRDVISKSELNQEFISFIGIYFIIYVILELIQQGFKKIEEYTKPKWLKKEESIKCLNQLDSNRWFRKFRFFISSEMTYDEISKSLPKTAFPLPYLVAKKLWEYPIGKKKNNQLNAAVKKSKYIHKTEELNRCIERMAATFKKESEKMAGAIGEINHLQIKMFDRIKDKQKENEDPEKKETQTEDRQKTAMELMNDNSNIPDPHKILNETEQKSTAYTKEIVGYHNCVNVKCNKIKNCDNLIYDYQRNTNKCKYVNSLTIPESCLLCGLGCKKVIKQIAPCILD